MKIGNFLFVVYLKSPKMHLCDNEYKKHKFDTLDNFYNTK